MENYDTNGIMSTFAIATTKANSLLEKIHNNPKMKEPRIPLILDEENEELWLKVNNKTAVAALLNPIQSDKLKYHTVNRLCGAAYKGNIAEISMEFMYEELEF
ncbi:SOS response-associated peptidase family protein [Spongiimicrobium salis]|uniref:SOS response-associated peptidase family protein n=1 Tax=Spongiimicrobium salis TaxID=1667022 RepID=UPI00374DF10F